MTYRENFVSVVKYNGKILRERDGAVTLPYGSEYSLLLKNLNSRKATVKVSVDGQDVLDGNSLIVRPNSDMELEGFLKGTKTTNKFRFIHKTKEIVDYRGDRIDDGLVRVEFKFEKKKVTRIVEEKTYKSPSWVYMYPDVITCPCCGRRKCCCPPLRFGDNIESFSSSTTWTNSDGGGSSYTNKVKGSIPTVQNFNCSFNSFSAPLDDEGITVKGSESDQSFSYGYTNELEEQSSVIIIKLRGTKSNGTKVVKPLTVKTRLRCSTCGKRSKSSAKFCRNCGTALD